MAHSRNLILHSIILYFSLSVCALAETSDTEQNTHYGKLLNGIEKVSKFKQVNYFGAKHGKKLVSFWELYFKMGGIIFDNLNLDEGNVTLDKIQTLRERLTKTGVKARNGFSCAKDFARLVLGLTAGDSWAVSFLDSFGKPGPSLTKGWLSFIGNYDQCRGSKAPSLSLDESEFTGQYCNLPITLSNDPFPSVIGLCLPSTCSSQELAPLFKQLSSSIDKTSISFKDVECLNEETSVTIATVLAIIILLVIGILTILGTFYDVLIVQWNTLWTPAIAIEEEEEGEEKGPYPKPSSSLIDDGNNITPFETKDTDVVAFKETTPLVPKTIKSKPHNRTSAKFLLAFSIYSNAKRVLSTSTSRESIGVIHGIRFLSISWVVLGHSFVFGGPGFTINFTTAIQTFLGRWTFDVILNALFSVDTFFTLSGLLTSYITIKELWSRGLRINWAMFYFHRLWRLTPPYMIVFVIVLGLQQYLGQGPLWGNEQPSDKSNCEKNWWANLLYINNLYRPQEPCFVHSWYLANDMQFFIISPVMLVPFYFSKRAGLISCTCVLVMSWITTGVLSYYLGWGVTILSSLENHWYDMYYIKPFTRIGPYVIGIIAGYILAEKRAKPFKMSVSFVVLSWLMAVASALAVVYGINGHYDSFGERPSESNIVMNVLYNTFSRSVWAVCVCWVIIACTAGYGGPIKALLSWSPFVVLGRLTYMTYLIHVPIINIIFSNFGSLYFMNTSTIVVFFVGLFTISNMVAFVAVIVLESPMVGIEKVFLGR